jgi:hypothetical protein
VVPLSDAYDAASYARSLWHEGEVQIERVAADSQRREVLEQVVDAISYELEQRVGQTFTTEQLARAWEDSESWCMEVAHRVAPEAPWAWDMTVVQGAAFSRFSRRAQDYGL